MTIDPQAIQALFARAIEIVDRAEREKFLTEQCCGDAKLYECIANLLIAFDGSKGFLDQPTQAHATQHIDVESRYQPGNSIAGRYKLLESIGEGGMGTVWVAEQSQPVRRKVALKLVKRGMDSKQVLARFDAERQALALMDHPNIAKVFDGGVTEQGRPFFAMEYVKGMPLTEYCDHVRLSLEERLELFVPICQAVQHAHQKGIIHRDLKPSNVLICLYDGKPVPKVIDFGLAKAMYQPLTEQTLHTGHGLMLGTPLYMSPEQAEHNNLDVDTRTDIYSLGVMLYELLTGTLPLERAQFKEAAIGEILRLIKEVEPPKPSTRVSTNAQRASIAAQRSLEPERLGRSIRGDLDWIVMKALDKERDRRYETANGLARDLERFLNQEAVEACPPSTVYRLKKQFQKHRAAISTAVAFLLLICASTVVSTWQAYRATKAEASVRQERDKAIENEREALAAKTAESTARLAEESARQQAEDNARTARKHELEAIKARERESATRLETERRVVRLCLSTGAKFNELEDTDAALLWFSQAWQFDPDERADEASHKLRIGLTLQQKPPIVGFAAHNDELKSACVDDQGHRGLALTKSGQAHLWELRQGRKIAQLDAGQPVIHLALNRAGSLALTGEESGRVQVWDAMTGKLLRTVHHGANLGALEWKPDGRIFATAGGDAGVRFWNSETGQAKPFRVDVNGVYYLSFDSAGTRFVAASMDSKARVWNAETGKPLTAPLTNSPPNAYERARFIRQGPVISPDGRTVLVSAGPGVTHIDIDSGKTLWTSNVGYRHQCFSIDGSKLLLSGPARSCYYLDSASGKVLNTFTTTRDCRHAVFIEQNLVATATSGGLIQLEETKALASKFQSRVLRPGGGNCNLKLLPNRRHFFVASKDGTMRLYDFKPDSSIHSPFNSGRANNMITAIGASLHTYSPNAVTECVFKTDRPTFLRPQERPTFLKSISRLFTGSPRPIEIDMPAEAARFCNSGEILGLVGPTSLRIWDPTTGTALGPIVPRPAQSRVAWSGDGRRVALSSGDRLSYALKSREKLVVRVLDTLSGKVLFEIAYPAPEEENNNLATLNEAGTVLATTDFSHDATVDIFDVDRGLKLSTVPAKSGTLSQLVLTPDGSRLLTVSSNTIARLWDCRSGTPIGPALKHPSFVRDGAIAHDGNRVATKDVNQILYLWDGTSGDLFGRWGKPSVGTRGPLWFSQDSKSICFTRTGSYQSVEVLPWTGDLTLVKDYVAIVTGQELDFHSGSIDVVPMDTFTRRPEEIVRAFRVTHGLHAD